MTNLKELIALAASVRALVSYDPDGLLQSITWQGERYGCESVLSFICFAERARKAVAPQERPSRHIDTAEVAKLIRQALKEAFPEIKFSVKISRYSMGSSVNISWNEGPTGEQVEAITKRFQNRGATDITDYAPCLRHTMNGEPVSFGASYVFTSRRLPQAKVDAAKEIFKKAPRGRWLNFIQRFGIDYYTASKLIDYNHDESIAYSFLLSVPQPQFDGRRSALADQISLVGSD